MQTHPDGEDGTYFTCRAYRTRGAVYAPTPYGEVCVDDDEETAAASTTYRSETQRDGRGLNPDWRPFGDDEGIAVDGGVCCDGMNALTRVLAPRYGETTKLELCVYGTRGETTKKRRTALMYRAVIDLETLVRVGDRVPNGVAIPHNSIFIVLSDGVYAPMPTASDERGEALRAFLRAVVEKERKVTERAMSTVVSNLIIDRVIVDGDDDGTKPGSKRGSTTASPKSNASMTAAHAWNNAIVEQKRIVIKSVNVRSMVSMIENLIEANVRLRDANEMRKELARRLAAQLSEFTSAPNVCKATRDTARCDVGLTLENRMTSMTSELADERENLALMKDDVGRRVRALRKAGEKLVEVNESLDDAERALMGPSVTGKLHQTQRALVARRWRLVGDIAEIFPITPVQDGESESKAYPLLQIGDVPLDLGPAPSKVPPLRADDLESDAAAYGIVAQICVQLAAILDVRLRYPVCPSLSRSYICDFHQVKPQLGDARDVKTPSTTLARIEFPLFMDDPRDRTKYTYGVFLLNKNLEQLLNAHGLNAVGPRHTLQNLQRIFEARSMIAADGSETK